MKRALVLSLIVVIGLGFSTLAASLTGSWDTDVTIDPQQSYFADAIGLTSVLTVNYIVGDWTFTSITKLTEAGWYDQDFNVAGVLGAFSFTSALDFDPTTPAFTMWKSTASVSIAGVSFGATFLLGDDTGTSAVEVGTALTLTAAGTAGDVDVSAKLVLGGNASPECDFDFNKVTFTIGFPFCCADITAYVGFDCSGFQYAEFDVAGIALPNMPWLSFDAWLVFDLDYGKELTLVPNLDFGDFACISLDIDMHIGDWYSEDPYDVYVGPPAGAITLGDIIIHGISLTCDIGAVTFTGVTDFFGGLGPYKWINWYTNDPRNIYFEYYKISTNDDACCGPFTFDLAFYFKEDGVALFDVALIDANMTLQVATQFTFNMGLMVDVDSGAFTQWTIGFLVTW